MAIDEKTKGEGPKQILRIVVAVVVALKRVIVVVLVKRNSGKKEHVSIEKERKLARAPPPKPTN